ncbi:MAG: ATP-dependent DNA helicase RecG, partial [Oscillospiraceae bacterium]
MTKLSDSVTYLKGVGERRAKCFEKLGVKTVEELLYHFPRGYMDFSKPVLISEAVLNETNIISGAVVKKMRPTLLRNGMTVYKAVFSDGESDITIIVYNSEYLFDQLKEGEKYILSGKITGNFIRKEISSPIIFPQNNDCKIQPVYPLTEGLLQNAVRNAVKNALKIFDEAVVETLPKWIMEKYELCALRYALENIHFPKDEKALEIAKKRLVFDELLILQLGMLMLKTKNRSLTGHRMETADLSGFYQNL